MLALAIGLAGGLKANSVLCSTGPTAASLVSTSCSQSFVATDFLNWGAPIPDGGLGEAFNPEAQEMDQSVVVATTQGVVVDATTNMGLERADNTAYAWDAATGSWVNPGTTYDINTFAGHFGAPSTPTSTPAYGDALLGATGGSYSGSDDAQLTLNFSQTIYGIAFDVSSASNANFIATLDAYDTMGDLLGVYQVNTNSTNVGGTCSTLTSTPNPIPCNNAPLIQFYDPEGRVASIVLTVNDTNGLYIDELGLTTLASVWNSDPAAPDPQTATLIGGGLVFLALASKRVRARQAKTTLPKI